MAVKWLKDASDAKFRREVFLFQELFSDDLDLAGPEAQSPLHAAGAPPDERVHQRSQRSPSLLQAGRSLVSACLPRPEEAFVRLLDHSPVDAFAKGECFCVLELGRFNLHDLRVHCADMAKKGKPHSLSQPDELRRVLLHVLRALSFLHGRLFVHGDLKPANVMWFGDAQQGVWKLIDLDGLLTTTQLIDMRDADFFTPIYAAPELAAAVCSEGALRVSRRLDVWAAGVAVLEMELLTPPLWGKFEELCAGSEDGEDLFMQWLARTPSPVAVPASGRAASAELLEILRASMLVDAPASRGMPQDLLAHPYLSGGLATVSGLPPPTLEEPPSPRPAKAKPRTAFQLFQEGHRAELEEETGLRGGKLLQELHRRWKQLQADGGEELERLKQQEAKEAAAAAGSKETVS